MSATIWEYVAANKIEVGDILAWNDDVGARVRVDWVEEHPTAEVLPAIDIHVQGPAVAFERMSGVSTGRLFRQGDPVRRMKRERAARVGANLRSLAPMSGDRRVDAFLAGFRAGASDL